MPKFILIWLLLLLLSGCQLPTDQTAGPEATEEPQSPAPARSIAAPTGRLAYLGHDGNVYVTTADRTTPLAITNDATARPEYAGYSYHRLSWSPTGQLAFAGVARTGDEARSRLYVTDFSEQPPRLVARDEDNFVIYIYWAPQPCPGQIGCHRLAYLIEEEARQMGLHLVDLNESQVDRQLVALGRPFYFSWSPSGQRIVWHTGGARRFNPQAQLAMYHLARDQVDPLPQSPGLFLAPAWSPRGERWLGVSAREAVDQLHSYREEESTLITSADDAYIAFVWSPQGNRLAYARQFRPNETVYGPLHLFDLESGQTERLTNRQFQTAGFFWSPDGQKIAYLKEGSPGADWLQWRVYDLARQEDRGFNAFVPSPHMWYMLSSFAQYAQSHRFWSPNSRYLVYADRDQELVDRVWLVDTWAERGASPLLVDKGAMGVWSWQ